MAWQLLASGGFADLGQLADYERLLGEHDRGKLRLELRVPASGVALSALEDELAKHNIPDLSVRGDGNLVDINFRKGFPWLAIIAVAIIGLIVLAIFIIGWQLFREIAAVLPTPVLTTGVLIGLLLLGLLMVGGISSRRRQG